MSREVFPTREEVIKAIENAVGDGYAQSYLLSSLPPHCTAVEFDPKRVDQFYYYLTPTGKKIVENAAQLGVGE